MKKSLFIILCTVTVSFQAFSQTFSDKDRAAQLAQNDFSKSKHKKKTINGYTLEMNKVIVSTPLYRSDVNAYNGTYTTEGYDTTYQVTVTMGNAAVMKITPANSSETQTFQFKNVVIHDAYFKADKMMVDGSAETIEGAFIDKDDDGNHTLGLGLKFPAAFHVTAGMSTDKLFLKKQN